MEYLHESLLVILIEEVNPILVLNLLDNLFRNYSGMCKGLFESRPQHRSVVPHGFGNVHIGFNVSRDTSRYRPVIV